MLDLCRAYASRGWRPLGIELDIARPASAARFEDAFGSPVRFDAALPAVRFPAGLLQAERPRHPGAPLLTIEDVARARLDPAGRDDLVGAISAQIRAQVFAGSVSLDSAARALDLSIRSLQRALNRDGTDFRSLANAIRARRAEELLRGTHAPVTRIAAQLGYSAPANFSRAFRKATGLAPEDFRRQHAAPGPAARVPDAVDNAFNPVNVNDGIVQDQ